MSQGSASVGILPDWEAGSLDVVAGVISRRIFERRNVRDIWSRWAPELAYGRHMVPPPPDARRAAVLMLLYPEQHKWRLPLIERIADATVHSGQVSFPGGAMDAGESPEQAARREFEEEVGLFGGSMQICGQLTPIYIFASNFVVTPCVAVAANRPNYQLNPSEVASLLELPTRELMNPVRFGVQRINRRGVTFHAPYLEYEGHFIWGATSMMLAELAAVLYDQEPDS